MLRHDSSPGNCLGYVQFFRDGSIEAVSAFPNGYVEVSLYENKPDIKIRLRAMEGAVTEALTAYLSLFHEIGIDGPVFLFLTVVGVKGACFYTESTMEGGYTLDRDLLNVPAILIENLTAEPETIVHEAFEILWQASGYVCRPR